MVNTVLNAEVIRKATMKEKYKLICIVIMVILLLIILGWYGLRLSFIEETLNIYPINIT